MPRSRAARRVVRVQDALEQDRQLGLRAQELELVPAQLGVRELGQELADRCLRVVLGRLRQGLAKDRVRGVVGDPDPFEERLPSTLEVAWLPAGHEGVDGEDDRLVAGPLRAVDQARGELAAARPCRAETTSGRRRPPRPPRARTTRPCSGSSSARPRLRRGRPRARRRGGRSTARRSAPAAPAPASRCRARWSRGRAGRRRGAFAARSASAETRPGWSASSPPVRRPRTRTPSPSDPRAAPRPAARARRSRSGAPAWRRPCRAGRSPPDSPRTEGRGQARPSYSEPALVACPRTGQS